MISSSHNDGRPAARDPKLFAASSWMLSVGCIKHSRSNGINSLRYGMRSSGSAIKFTDAPTICTPFIFVSCACSRIARHTIGKMRPNEHESTVFMKVVFDKRCNASAALSMLALSKMLVMIVSAMVRISGVPATSWPMCLNKTSASFFTSFLASPTASRTAIMTLGIMRPNCMGVCVSMRCSMSRRIPMHATLTFHLPAAAAPKCPSTTGKINSGTARPRGPPFASS
mmetsp:Transcript_95232/g.274264  ORF Transcript_95232/g.274264 Transcript_95232/m.274264 type:complete len:227 (+) Transcript_95232:1351-2031(+)